MAVNGWTLTPKFGRRFRNTTFTAAVDRVAKRVSAVAEEQRSKDASVVLENYLLEDERRRHRREEARDDLEGLLGVFKDLRRYDLHWTTLRTFRRMTSGGIQHQRKSLDYESMNHAASYGPLYIVFN